MYDVITFGSASYDIFVKSKEFLPVFGENFHTGKGICLTLGSKVEVEGVAFSSGGGGTNTAATFAKQGFKIAYCGMIGEDVFGHLIIEELNSLKIDTDFILKTEKKPTNISVSLSYPKKDKTLLVYRGASDLLKEKDIPWQKIKNSKWIYLSPFSGELVKLARLIVDFAYKNKIKVALNPGYGQLKLPKTELNDILSKIDVLFLNQEEAALLTGISYNEEKEIFKVLDRMVRGITVMTKGDKGVIVSDGECLYKAGVLKTKIVDLTGAGDAFGSGFVTALIKSRGNIEHAIQFGTANSAANLREWGAKIGILEKNQKYTKIKVIKEKCSKNNYCHTKI